MRRPDSAPPRAPRSSHNLFALVLGLLPFAAACTPADPRARPGDVPEAPGVEAAPAAASVRAANGEGTLLLLADIRGVLRPCGCTKELQLGGFDRLAPIVAEARGLGPTLTLHAGPLFHEATPEEEGLKGPQRERQAEVVAELVRAVGLDLAAAHPLDEARDPKRYRRLMDTAGTRVVGAGGVAPGSALPSETREVGGVRVGVIALSPPLAASDPTSLTALARTLAALKPEVDVTIALSGLGLRETRRLVRQVPGLDFAVVGGMGEHPTAMTEAELEGGTRLIQLHREGRNLGRLVLRRSGGLSGGSAPLIEGPARPDALTFAFELVRLPWTLPQEARLAERMSAFDKELARINIASAGTLPAVKPGEATYVGVEACLACHAETKPFWETTRHAIAWETLEKLEKTFDTECVSCHVTGYGKAGGSLVGQVTGREDVQCEACHGPGSLHAADGDVSTIVRAPAETTCTACHNAHHSPSFAFGPFRERLLVPGHGRPPASRK
jgi:hypothetical protein